MISKTFEILGGQKHIFFVVFSIYLSTMRPNFVNVSHNVNLINIDNDAKSYHFLTFCQGVRG